MSNEYKVISKFECHGEQMVIVRTGNTAHVMSLEEWHKVYGRSHQEKWETKVDWNRFVPKDGYKKKVS